MARFVDAIDLPFSPIAAFDYLAGFEHTAEWDPGVTAARRLDPSAPLGRGSQFGVEVAFQWVGARAVQGLERRVAELARRERRRSASAKSRVTLVAAE